MNILINVMSDPFFISGLIITLAGLWSAVVFSSSMGYKRGYCATGYHAKNGPGKPFMFLWSPGSVPVRSVASIIFTNAISLRISLKEKEIPCQGRC
jgi:hypothetical protein